LAVTKSEATGPLLSTTSLGLDFGRITVHSEVICLDKITLSHVAKPVNPLEVQFLGKSQCLVG